MQSFVCITGATGGLGKAFAVECANRGWNLFITDISENALSRLADGLETAYGIKVLYYACDLTDADSRAWLIEEMSDRKICLDGLINVAGLDFEGNFFDRTKEQIRTLIRLNVEANLEITNELLKLRNRDKTFRIINVASLAAFYPMPVKAMYSASKRFLLNFSIALREELRPMNCTVTVLCPAGMPTNEKCIRSIDAQGFAGRITTKNVGYVAACTIDASLKGKAVCIPGLTNKIVRFAGSLVPSGLVSQLIGARWKEAHRKACQGNKPVLRTDN
ncbi:MAG: SDR family NAD(P)-dependent oxidoreductase [Clostridiaceae bacterium]|nr:SDR family NAD(P)-dependent oxidoreductase [Clostridiaceae bacterium]